MAATIRPATVADAAAIGTMHVRAWRVGYRGIMPDAYLDDLQPAQREAMWRDLLGRDDPDRHCLVLEHDGRLVGSAAFGPSRDAATADGELYSLNVDPDEWGRGHGGRLLREVADGLRAAGYPEAVLFVVVENARARRLYESDGWTVDGAPVTEEVLGVEVREVRYRRILHR
jgi:ribosomal protein S18 acetylase RimI-like enzyme